MAKVRNLPQKTSVSCPTYANFCNKLEWQQENGFQEEFSSVLPEEVPSYVEIGCPDSTSINLVKRVQLEI